ncbi:hypothetical protein HRW18_11690 [Streptomyces lunaelactis]|uniref:hypothetical protein n=1 Tax=Streptomyces lunaelactis TaxID=1535768 RepID=UPI0015855731|nr:hypothetical protein [Streptomyces lunaelactis]NUK08660.1 hypothetical protein [Streptomyces lunaelactis]NUL10751.1 hypothetical protein [Streptomyces lunaelactis]
MAITISLVLFFGIALVLLLRFKALGAGAAIVAVLFGFYLADTDARTTVNDLMGAVVNALPER